MHVKAFKEKSFSINPNLCLLIYEHFILVFTAKYTIV